MLTLVLRDANDNPVPGMAGSLGTTVRDDKGNVMDVKQVTVGGFTEPSPGTYQATLTGIRAGKVRVSALAGDKPASNQTPEVTLTADGRSAGFTQTGLAIKNDGAVADGSAAIDVQAQVTDANHNAVAGARVIFSVTGDATLTQTTVTTGDDGQARTQVMSTKAGTYTVTATLQENGQTATKDISFTAGQADAKQSGIVFDGNKKQFAAGEAMAVTVTLRDVNGNVVSGQAGLQKDAVTVPGADTAQPVSWTAGKVSGTYQATFTAKTAGEGQQATLTLNNEKQDSGTYTITAGQADAKQSAFAASPKRITADNVATSTLTLTVKDAQGNVLTDVKDSVTFAVTDSLGKAPASGTVTLDAVQSDTTGTYTATLRGTAAGEYTVVPQLNGSALGRLSDTVTLTAGAADAGQSGIVFDGGKNTFTAGEAMAVTVTLRDVNGNVVSGQAGLLKDAVTVPGADTAQPVSWTESPAGSGVYQASFTAKTAGKGLQATLTLNNVPKNSGTYTIRAGAADADQSAVNVSGGDNGAFISGQDMTVTVRLRDANKNAVTGAVSSLTTDAVTVPGTAAQSQVHWTEGSGNDEGMYSATYTVTAQAVRENLQATLNLAGWDESKLPQSSAYTIIPAPELKDVTVNGYTFAKDAGFPITGFTGATFTLNLTRGKAEDFDWTSSEPSWVDVKNGVVTLTGEGTRDEVTITGTLKAAPENRIEYRLTVPYWFKYIDRNYSFQTAEMHCRQEGYALAPADLLGYRGYENMGPSVRKPSSGLWSEWGNLKDAGLIRTSYDPIIMTFGRYYAEWFRPTTGEFFWDTHNRLETKDASGPFICFKRRSQ